jgi:hypothetical protein
VNLVLLNTSILIRQLSTLRKSRAAPAHFS